MKTCLTIYFSQSGQSLQIAEAITKPLMENFELLFEKLQPTPPFPFPWKGMSFFQVFPETVMEIPFRLQPLNIDASKKYDLVILAFPVWYLSPPIPFTSFLNSEMANELLQNTPVITVLGVRNMWTMAMERMKSGIEKAGGKHVGNIVLEDPHNNLVSVVTIVRWMMTGEKHGRGLYSKIFPPAGVPEATIQHSSLYGKIILEAFRENDLDSLQEKLVSHGAVRPHPVLVSIENRARVMFGILARWILKKGEYENPARTGRLKIFKYYLFLVIYLVSPIASIIFRLNYFLNPKKYRETIKRYSAVK